MGCVRVLVVDDHPVVRDGVEMLAQSCSGIALAGYAASGKEALDIVERAQPHVILLDLRLPDVLAPELIRALRERTTAKIVLFTAYPDHPAVGAALDAGADGMLPKDASRMDLVEGITRAMRPDGDGGRRASGPQRRDARSPIARREYDVLRRVATGETNLEIADAMNLSPNTIKAYLRTCMQKLDARNRVEAISRAREMGLL
jgi:DNA-binding NarL/FixJ family response regulator